MTSDKRTSDRNFDAHVTRQNEITVGCNVLLLKSETDNILVDVGPRMGNATLTDKECGYSKLRKALKEASMTPRDVNKIILTSTDSDHAGALTMSDRAGNEVPTFSRATVYCQDNQHERARPHSIVQSHDAFELLEDKGKLHTISSTEQLEVSPGVFVHSARGPSQWSAVVEVKRGADRIIFLGDLCPTPSHLNLSVTTAHDNEPDHTYREKKYWLDKAEEEGAVLVFCHGNAIKAGYLESTKEGRRLRAL